jgi:ArsR family transcriptional regulator
MQAPLPIAEDPVDSTGPAPTSSPRTDAEVVAVATADEDRGEGRLLFSDRERATRIADVIRALGHPVRLCIAARLCSGEAYVGELARELSAPQTVISQQLRILRMHGLVAVSRTNSHAYYRLAEPRLRDFIGCVDGLCVGSTPAS